MHQAMIEKPNNHQDSCDFDMLARKYREQREAEHADAGTAHDKAPAGYDLISKKAGEHFKEVKKAAEGRMKVCQNNLQFQLFMICINAFDTAMKERTSDLVAFAAEGINTAFFVTETSPYLFYATNEAGRIVASPLRGDMKQIHAELARLPASDHGSLAMTATVGKALSAAMIACEKGAIHIARENLGYVLKTIAAEHSVGSPRTRKIWTDKALSALRRSSNCQYKVP